MDAYHTALHRSTAWSVGDFGVRPQHFSMMCLSTCIFVANDNMNRLTFCVLVDLSIHTDTISIGLPIVHFKGSQLKSSK